MDVVIYLNLVANFYYNNFNKPKLYNLFSVLKD